MQSASPQTITLDSLLKDPKNQHCADCNGYPTKYISINNGIFICEDCHKIHLLLPTQISHIKPLNEKQLTLNDLKLISYGGNENFQKFMNTYGIGLYPAKSKYNTLAAQFYRENVNVFSQRL